MKKLLIPFLLIAALGSAQAGVIACSGDKSDKKDEKSSFTESVGSLAGKDKGDKECDKSCGGEKATASLIYSA